MSFDKRSIKRQASRFAETGGEVARLEQLKVDYKLKLRHFIDLSHAQVFGESFPEKSSATFFLREASRAYSRDLSSQQARDCFHACHKKFSG